MSDYQPAQVGYFLGNVESFPFTPEADTAPNSIIICGKLIGVTRYPVKAGEKGAAFLTTRHSVYHLELAAEGTQTDAGTEVYADADGKITASASGNTAVGCLYQGIEAGDTFAQVLLYPAG